MRCVVAGARKRTVIYLVLLGKLHVVTCKQALPVI